MSRFALPPRHVNARSSVRPLLPAPDNLWIFPDGADEAHLYRIGREVPICGAEEWRTTEAFDGVSGEPSPRCRPCVVGARLLGVDATAPPDFVVEADWTLPLKEVPDFDGASAAGTFSWSVTMLSGGGAHVSARARAAALAEYGGPLPPLSRADRYRIEVPEDKRSIIADTRHPL